MTRPTLLSRHMIAGVLAATAALVSTGAQAGPVDKAAIAKGQATFAACAVCHATTPGVRKIGPSLFGVVGRKAGTVPGFAYSNAMKSFGKKWTPAELDAYLASPAKDIPGNRMPYGGMPNPEQRKAIIAYLATLK